MVVLIFTPHSTGFHLLVRITKKEWHNRLCVFSTDAVAFLKSHFGASSGTRTVHLDEVQCTGTESKLTDCPQSSTASCSPVDSYAGVRCQGLEEE